MVELRLVGSNRARRALLALCLVGATAAKAQSPYIAWSNKAVGETLSGTLEAFQKLGVTNAEIAASLSAKRKSLAVVFVPGILGSKLVDKDGRTIYGDLSSPTTLLSRLELPADLVDENVESGIRASLLRSLGPMDLYGDAVAPMEKWASANNVKLVTCGYDWRRDIRSGARDVERCINKELGAGYPDIALVAHSMGGLVSWTWAAAHERGEYSPSRRLVQFTVLGSPLNGSCEIVRMIQSGYVQPRRVEKLQIRGDLKPLSYFTEKLVDAFKNGVSGAFTQGIRPLVLTWPGALELSPAPTANGAVTCVGVPPPDDAPAGTPATTYYDEAFWGLPAGKQMLRQGGGTDSFATRPSLPTVLAKAKNFRTVFKASQLRAPTWLYYSQIWQVPSAAGYRAPYVAEADQWTTAWGDGRVPEDSAKNGTSNYVFAHVMGLESVHGNLPADPNFFDDYFGLRLPQALAAIWATDLMREASSKPDWIAAFAKLRPQGAETSQVQSALEPRGNKELSKVLQEAIAAVAQFNNLVCASKGCAQTYAAAKQSTNTPTGAFGSLGSLAQYSAVTRSLESTHPDFPYAEGNRGLVLAKRQDWSAAAVSMQKAKKGLEIRAEESTAFTKPQALFRDIVQRNLAKSLVESGSCKAAEPLLRASINSWPYAKEALSKPCNDLESGLQYCFDTGDYCRK